MFRHTLFSPQFGNNVVFIKLFSEFAFDLNQNSVFSPFDHINVWLSDAQIEAFLSGWWKKESGRKREE